MPIHKMLEKADRILKRNRIERLDGDKFNVIGDHGTYSVVQSIDGKIHCNCPGFIEKGVCSHSLAVKKYLQYYRGNQK